MRKVLLALLGLAVFTVGALVGAAAASPSAPKSTGTAVDEAAADAATTAAEAVKAPSPTPKPTDKLADGNWSVPSEAKPGTYTTVADGHCYWARLKNFDGELDSIITNGNLAPGAKGRIVVKKTDKGLELGGGCAWVRSDG